MLQPHALINSHGKVHLGHFLHPVNEINFRDADYRTPLNARASKRQKHFHFKQFQYFGGIGDNLIFGCAMADLRYLGAVFIYCYYPQSKKMLSWSFKTPLSQALKLTHRPDNGISVFKQFGRNQKVIMNYQHNSAGERKITLDITLGKELKLDAEMRIPKAFPFNALCTPTGSNGWTYAQKLAALPVQGQLRHAEGNIDLGQDHCFGHHDLSAGYMRRETFWNWACFSCATSKQQAMGLNVSWGVNETGYSENCFWLGDKLYRLPQVQFRFDRDNDTSAWRIQSEDQRVDLTFRPEGMHREKMNVILLATHFRQLFGQFTGHVVTPDGARHSIDNVYGFVEDHYSKW